jgi:hypothetical protein
MNDTGVTKARKPVPLQMWVEMRKADLLTNEDITTAVSTARNRILKVGETYGFTEAEMIEHGLVGRPEPPRRTP